MPQHSAPGSAPWTLSHSPGARDLAARASAAASDVLSRRGAPGSCTSAAASEAVSAGVVCMTIAPRPASRGGESQRREAARHGLRTGRPRPRVVHERSDARFVTAQASANSLDLARDRTVSVRDVECMDDSVEADLAFDTRIAVEDGRDTSVRADSAGAARRGWLSQRPEASALAWSSNAALFAQFTDRLQYPGM